MKKDNKGREREVVGRIEEISEEFAAPTRIVRDGIGTKEEFEFSCYQEKTIGLWIDVIVLYLDEDKK